jgi:hypothetical protein
MANHKRQIDLASGKVFSAAENALNLIITYLQWSSR